MKVFRRFLILLILPTIAYGEPNFEELILQKCALTEYKKFIECVEDLKSTNGKPTASSPSCKLCDCGKCKREDHGGFLENNCCRNCCPFKPCETRHCCFKTCHSGCETAECRYSCRHSCFSYIEKENGTITYDSSRIKEKDALDITTKININNVINNTNSFEIPVKLNSNNRNEIMVNNENNIENALSIRDSTCCKKWNECEQTRIFPFLKCNLNTSSLGRNSSIKNVHINQANLTLVNNESLPINTPIYSSFTWSQPIQSFSSPAYTDPYTNYYPLYSRNPQYFPFHFYSPNTFTANVPIFVPFQNSPSPSYNPYQDPYTRTPYTTFSINKQFPFVPNQISFQPYWNYPMGWTNYGRNLDYLNQQFVPLKTEKH